MAMEYTEFLKAPALLEPYHQIFLCHYSDTRWGVLTLCIDAVGIYSTIPVDWADIRLGFTKLYFCVQIIFIR